MRVSVRMSVCVSVCNEMSSKWDEIFGVQVTLGREVQTC